MTLRQDSSIVDVYERVVKALDASFAYAPNKRFERFQLRSMRQHSGDSVSKFEAKLQAQALHCCFTDEEAVADQVCDQLLTGIRNNNLQKKTIG